MANGDQRNLGLGPIGIGAEFIQNLLRSNDKVVKTQPQDKIKEQVQTEGTPPPENVNLPEDQQPQPLQQEPTEQPGLGIEFLQRLAQEQGAEIQPTPFRIPTVSELQENLSDSGFKDDPNNIIEFSKNNIQSDASIIDHSNLKAQDDETLVDPRQKFVRDAIKSVPAVQVLSNFIPTLGVIIEGLERYEAAKTTFITSAIKGQVPDETLQAILTGKVKSKFVEARLRGSEQPEFGDIFRSLGLKEETAATLGLTAEIITDIPLLGGLGVLAKTLKARGAAKLSDVVVKENFLGLKNSTFAKDLLNAAQGKGIFDTLNPAVKQTIRQNAAGANKQVFDAGILSALIHNSVIKKKGIKFAGATLKDDVIDDVALLRITDAITEGIDGPAFQSLAKDQQTLVREARQMIDNLSENVATELDQIIKSNPEKFQKQLTNFLERSGQKVEGKVLPADLLVNTIRANKGTYVRRYYEMFLNNKYKPTVKAINEATEGLVNDGFAKNADEAKQILDEFLETKSFQRASRGGRLFRVNTESFRGRQDIPEYMRNFMGEVKDPRYLLIQTTRDLAEASSNLRILRNMDELGLFVDQASKTHKIPIKGGPLSFGVVDGKFTTQEVADVMRHISESGSMLDRITMNMMKGLKVAKTIFNPKTHGHNMMGNIVFSMLAGNSIVNPANRAFYGEMLDVWRTVGKVKAGKLTRNDPRFKLFQEMVDNGVIGTELPSADKLKFLEDLLINPYSAKKISPTEKSFKEIARVLADLYTFEDVFYKGATYLKYTKGRKMVPKQAVDELYKWYPNYFEAAKIADLARNTPLGLMFLNPFTTFRAEAHRIMLNGFKDSNQSRMITGAILGSRLAWNTAMLSLMGNNLNDIWAYYNSRPEAVSEVLINPLSEKDFDLNTRYLDPFNTRGLFDPLLWAAGVHGTSPFDYILDFTTMSPDFGFSNLLVNAIEPAVTGIGRFGQELSPTERALSLTKGLGPTSFTTDLPKIVDPEEDPKERFRRSLRFIGIDVEKRNPSWINQQVAKTMRKAVREGDDTTSLVRALNVMGFEGERIKKNAERKVARETKKEKEKGQFSKKQDFIENALREIGLTQ